MMIFAPPPHPPHKEIIDDISRVTCFLQDAKKGVLFIDFPPVLQLQLKRFEYDFMRDTMVKVSILNVNINLRWCCHVKSG